MKEIKRPKQRCSKRAITTLWRTCSRSAYPTYFVITWYAHTSPSANRINKLVKELFGLKPSVHTTIKTIDELHDAGLVIASWRWKSRGWRQRELVGIEVV